MKYAQGFADGERAAFKDRADHLTRQMPIVRDDYSRGYVDGYTPRTIGWALRAPVESLAWWVDREEAINV